MSIEQADLRFEQDLRTVIRSLAPVQAPVSLRMAVAEVTTRQPTGGWARPRLPQFAATAAVALTIVVAGGLLLALISRPTGLFGGGPSVTPTPLATSSPAPTTLQAALEFQVLTQGHAATKDEVSAIVDVMEKRLQVLSPAQFRTVTVGGDQDTVRMTFDFSSDASPALARFEKVMSAPGNVTFVPLGPLSDIQPGATIDPSLPALFDGSAVTSATIGSTQTGQLAVDITLSAAAADTFDNYAASHYQEQFAIVLDGRIVTAPVIQATRFDGQLQLSGNDDEFTELAAVLSSGPLPYPVRLVSEPKAS
jgi:preprotein translocase subunit SecD